MSNTTGGLDTAPGQTGIVVEPGKQEIIITRVFEAPRDLVFRALIDPKLVPEWWGPRDLTTEVDVMDVRPGGQWRFLNRDAGGTEYGFHGVYHDVAPAERLVYTFEFEGVPGHVLLETVTLDAVEGGTRITDRSVFQTVEDRDAMVRSGMESGARQSMERLAELLRRL
jgi:uncharacterized protein YndB with AHSA1/START domain